PCTTLFRSHDAPRAHRQFALRPTPDAPASPGSVRRQRTGLIVQRKSFLRFENAVLTAENAEGAKKRAPTEAAANAERMGWRAWTTRSVARGTPSRLREGAGGGHPSWAPSASVSAGVSRRRARPRPALSPRALIAGGM